MKRNLLAKIALCVVSFILSMAAAEMVFRWHETRALKTQAHLDGDPIDLGMLNYNETIVPRAKSVGEFRILSFGDSFGYSIMAPPYSYSGLLESHLNQANKGWRFRVVNLGEAASTVTDYAAGYSFWSQKFEHDAVLFNIYLGNDLLDVAYHYTPVEWQPSRAFKDLPYHMLDGSSRSKVPKKFPLRTLDHAYAYYLTSFQMETNESTTLEVPDQRFNIAARHNLSEEVFLDTNRTQLVNFDFAQVHTLSDGYRAMIGFFQYISDLRRAGVRTIVTLSPSEIHVDQALRERVAATYGIDLEAYDLTLPARAVTAIRDRIDPEIDLIDLAPYFVRRSEQGQRLYYSTNTHWGPEGNALAGEVIARHLLSLWFNESSALATSDCDVQEYARRFNRIPDSRIAEFVASLAADPQAASQRSPPTATPPITASVPKLAVHDFIPEITCGSLDGIKVDKGGDLLLWGWAYDPRTQKPAREVVLLVNGQEYQRAPVALERPDVVSYFEAPALSLSGWNLRVPSLALPSGRHTFTAFALFEDGKYGTVPGEGRGVVVIGSVP